MQLESLRELTATTKLFLLLLQSLVKKLLRLFAKSSKLLFNLLVPQGVLSQMSSLVLLLLLKDFNKTKCLMELT